MQLMMYVLSLEAAVHCSGHETKMHVLPFQIEGQLTSQAASETSAAASTAASVDECPICLMEIDMVSDPLAVLKPCGHIFHEGPYINDVS